MRFDFIKNRFFYYAIALVLVAISVVAPFAFPLNLGIDMTGGVQAEYEYTNTFNIDAAKQIVDEAKKTVTNEGKEVINTVSVYKISGENKFVVEAGFSRDEKMNDAQYEGLKTSFKDALDAKFQSISSSKISLSRYINIGESFGEYIKSTAYMTLVLVIVFISLYIAYAFRGAIEGVSSLSFAAVTAISLFHDVLVAFGLYIIASFFFPEYKIDTFFITAMLTILGYSINDTIVVMDRIRSNLKLPENKKKGLGEIINNSINDTLARSLYTSFTVFIVLVALFFFGPVAIKGFILALIFGTVIGTYSSIVIASPLLYDMNKIRK